MGQGKRRSDRVNLTIPLRVHAKDEKGRSFKGDGRTIILSRHGALISVSHPFRLGQTVRLVNEISGNEAYFRVVGPVSPATGKGGEWAVEYVAPQENIWGIHFPSTPEGEPDQPKALLECRICHGVALLRISLEAVDVLKTSGILSKHCFDCEKETPWGYTEKGIAMDAPADEAKMIADVRAMTSGKERRRHRRIAMQLPVLIRDFWGGGEITKTEDVSKKGLCFASEKTYFVGQGIKAVCPYSPSHENIEMSARIVRRIDIEAIKRKIYGVRYEQETPPQR